VKMRFCDRLRVGRHEGPLRFGDIQREHRLKGLGGDLT
jgi:hypothetical protein